MSDRTAYTGARIFDGELWWERSMLIVNGTTIEGIAAADSPLSVTRVPLGGGILVPGLIDLQVNGGGGALLNLTPDVATIETICATYLRYGTTACLPTFITDTREKTAAVIEAGADAAHRNVPGFLGLHLEGPHLSVARKGAHDPALIRPMDEADLGALVAARKRLPHLLTTVAAETVTPGQIARLVAAGIVVSIGHSDATYAQMKAAQEAGATLVTHLFNAQSQMGNREPGVAGAVLDLGGLSASVIADGIHVHPATIAAALRGKRGPGRIFAITDAMSPTGTDMQSFDLTGRMVYRRDGALRLADGTLAGADLTLSDAVKYLHSALDLPLEEGLRMASLYPAELLGAADRGKLAQGLRADFAHFADDMTPRQTFVGGASVWRA
jgi:N-acetylglucosamine-6-phosphate deacetylase